MIKSVFLVQVDIATSGCHVDEDESRRIFIGTIPIASLQYPPNSNFETANNAQGITSYPAPPIVNQPMANGVPYPGANPPYPGANPPYPGANPPYPGANPPYPGANPPYPGNTQNIGFTAENPPYPTVSPYPAPSPYPVGDNPPYPGGDARANPPYPAGNPNLVTAQHTNSAAPYPNSGRTSPYPPNVEPTFGQNPSNLPYPASPNVGSSPYPTNVGANQQSNSNTSSPYANPVGSGLKTGTIGFTSSGAKESMPLLPLGGMPLVSFFEA